MSVARVVADIAHVHRRPEAAAPLETQALHGEAVEVLAGAADGFVEVRLAGDGYVGFVRAAALGAAPEPTHVVAVPASLVYATPDFKTPPAGMLGLGARVRVERIEGRYARLADGRHAIAGHLAAVGTLATDPVAVAETLLGAPYLWGGKSWLGIDCSGLVQLAHAACGVRLPRDSGPQERHDLGQSLPPGTALRRGDLVFWKGHVALARGDGTMIHANAHHMAVAIEGVAEGLARIAAAGDPVTSVRRIGQAS